MPDLAETKTEEVRVLLIEDNAADSEWVKRTLQKSRDGRFNLQWAETLSKGLELLEQSKFDVILLDMRLPDGYGLELLDKVLSRASHLPIIILTGDRADEKIALQAIEHGAQDYLLKGALDSESHIIRALRYSIERKQAERKIEEATQIKSDFISMVSHELRTPLAVIKESVGIVRDGIVGAINSEQEEFLTTAMRNINRLARLINSVLVFQKLEAGQAETQMTENDINQLVNEIRENFVRVAKNKGLELLVELEEGLAPIPFDRDQITQVLINFMNNALEVMTKGMIVLKTRCFENGVRVSVEDQGPGIKEEDFQNLFKIFGQLTKGNERKTGNSGLGLAICKQIIETHKGKIGVESVYGKGATFYFLLPLKNAEILKNTNGTEKRIS